MLTNHYITEQKNLKRLSGNLPLYMCTNCFESVSDVLNIPSVKDSATLRMMGLSEMKESLADGVSYLSAYKKTGPSEFRFYAVPECVFETEAGLAESVKERMEMFTISELSLSAPSGRIFPGETVFHAFADGQKIMMTVSRDDTVFYTRTMMHEPDGDKRPDSFFYECINLTYMYVTKNLRIKTDRMLFSGGLTGRAELAEMLFGFCGVPLSVPAGFGLVSGCPQKIFEEFALPVYTAMLSSAYDFTPERYREKRGFAAGAVLMNLLALAAVFVLLMFNLSEFDRYSIAKDMYASQTNMVKLKLERNLYNFSDSDGRRFGYYYLKTLRDAENEVLSMIDDTAELLDTGNYESVLLSSGRGIPEVFISGDVSFSSFREIDLHRQRVADSLKKLSSGYRTENGTRYDMDRLSSDIKIKLEKLR